jgi:ABC-type amino acid transport system permease subunit
MALQLFIMFFVIFAVKGFPSIIIAIVAFGLNSAAYTAEVIRGGILSVDPGQTEAGMALGLSQRTIFMKIVAPQAIKNILPALGNEFIVLIKESSVAGVIAVTDLTKAAQYVGSATWRILPPLYVAAGCYLIMVLGLTKLLNIFERRLAQGDHN